MNKKIIFISMAIFMLVMFGWLFISPAFNAIEVNDTFEEHGLEVLQESESFKVIDTFGHPASGLAKIVQMSNGSRYIRFENLETINGPNLHLYLAKSIKGKDFIDLGPIKGTNGNINYLIPENVDIEEYNYVLHWCVPFSVLFNYVFLN